MRRLLVVLVLVVAGCDQGNDGTETIDVLRQFSVSPSSPPAVSRKIELGLSESAFNEYASLCSPQFPGCQNLTYDPYRRYAAVTDYGGSTITHVFRINLKDGRKHDELHALFVNENGCVFSAVPREPSVSIYSWPGPGGAETIVEDLEVLKC
jgi:hypothetical protein